MEQMTSMRTLSAHLGELVASAYLSRSIPKMAGDDLVAAGLSEEHVLTDSPTDFHTRSAVELELDAAHLSDGEDWPLVVHVSGPVGDLVNDLAYGLVNVPESDDALLNALLHVPLQWT